MLYDHVDLRVRSLEGTRALYDALLRAMGFTELHEAPDSVGYHAPSETGRDPFLWLVENDEHAPGETRVAFHAAARAEVDRLADIAAANGATNVEPPELVREYGDRYYATFFEDPEGNKLEICCRVE